jgi:hypothetical protein
VNGAVQGPWLVWNVQSIGGRNGAGPTVAEMKSIPVAPSASDERTGKIEKIPARVRGLEPGSVCSPFAVDYCNAKLKSEPEPRKAQLECTQTP